MCWELPKKSLEERIKDKPKCLHDDCPECHGTGKKENGQICVHFLSCPCPKCTPQFRSI